MIKLVGILILLSVLITGHLHKQAADTQAKAAFASQLAIKKELLDSLLRLVPKASFNAATGVLSTPSNLVVTVAGQNLGLICAGSLNGFIDTARAYVLTTPVSSTSANTACAQINATPAYVLNPSTLINLENEARSQSKKGSSIKTTVPTESMLPLLADPENTYRLTFDSNTLYKRENGAWVHAQQDNHAYSCPAGFTLIAPVLDANSDSTPAFCISQGFADQYDAAAGGNAAAFTTIRSNSAVTAKNARHAISICEAASINQTYRARLITRPELNAAKAYLDSFATNAGLNSTATVSGQNALTNRCPSSTAQVSSQRVACADSSPVFDFYTSAPLAVYSSQAGSAVAFVNANGSSNPATAGQVRCVVDAS